ncbi:MULTISPECIES: SLC13 family permease [unclassified Oceanobacter]|uniref:SLC13 family permease n=2 Tax=Gammaproteobacteria TaxID=1236 RepID=UPI0027323AA7|nr:MULTISPECIES: SLC13 family permease [unclassified Oceanobacter]MDP2548540.1 SLC13 family permease [Oceanobacter sp. 4_MG-2023]MDP2608065.1 SLC13 family permease [Oceanobacter sp. 1_MG-2023]MDP2611273.1 SLC13 family permease [Oceanobacter sp. 2_MG-2023]
MDLGSSNSLVDTVFVAGLLMVVLVGLSLNVASAEKLFTAALMLLLLAGVLAPAEAFVGFSNTGIFTIAALYVVVGGLKESGATQVLRRYLVGNPKNQTSASLRVLPVTTLLSAVVNNTPVVAMFTTLLQSQSKRFSIQLSSILIPVSYASILGGTCTLIGTSTNLVVDGMLRQGGYTGFGLFEIAWVGIPIAILGLIYIFLAGRYLLPDRESSVEQFDQVREYLVEMMIQPGSELVRKNIQEAGLRNLPGLFLVEIEREEQIISAVRPRTVLEAGDRLVFAGSPESVLELRNIHGLVLANDQRFKLNGASSDRRLFEAVLSPSNPMIGQTIREARFRHRYSAVVLSVSRHGQRLRGKLGELVLCEGDTLLVEAQKGFLMRHRNSRDFLLVSKLGTPPLADETKALPALAIFTVMLIASGTGMTSILVSSIAAAGAMLAMKCITYEDAGKSIDYSILLVVACAFGLGAAVEKVGLAKDIASGLLAVADSPLSALIAVYLATVLLTEMMTNNAAAIIMLPICLNTAEVLGANYEPFAIAVMVAASASFMTPTGYQTNLMVMGPGGYRFMDYVKFGTPLSIIVAVTSVSVIPVVWSF